VKREGDFSVLVSQVFQYQFYQNPGERGLTASHPLVNLLPIATEIVLEFEILISDAHISVFFYRIKMGNTKGEREFVFFVFSFLISVSL